MIPRKHYIPRAYAEPVINFMTSRPRCAIWAPPGFGKTIMTYTAIDALILSGELTRPTLVLGPLRVARDVWTDEAHKWDHLHEISVSPVVGDEKQRKFALKKDASVYTTNYEQLPWLVKHFGDAWPFQMVVADESTKLKNFRLTQGGVRSAALGKVAHSLVDYWINLTGTPSPNGLKDLWGQTWFLDQGVRLGRTFSAFKERWFYSSFDGFGIKPHKHSEAEIHGKLQDLCLALDPKDWFDLEEPIVNTVRVHLPAKAAALYKDFEKTMFMELAEIEIEAFNAAALTSKCMQLANGSCYHGIKREYEVVHDAKIEALGSVIEESGGIPVLVAYQFVSDKERLLKAFPDAVILSETEGLKRFKAGNAQIGIFHPASVGHGVDGLQYVTNVMVFFSSDWNLETRMQAIERIGPVRQFQAGFKRPVFIHNLVAEGTIDEEVLLRHDSKRETQDILMEALNHTRRKAA